MLYSLTRVSQSPSELSMFERSLLNATFKVKHCKLFAKPYFDMGQFWYTSVTVITYSDSVFNVHYQDVV